MSIYTVICCERSTCASAVTKDLKYAYLQRYVKCTTLPYTLYGRSWYGTDLKSPNPMPPIRLDVKGRSRERFRHDIRDLVRCGYVGEIDGAAGDPPTEHCVCRRTPHRRAGIDPLHCLHMSATFPKSSVATLNRALVRMSAEESAVASAAEWAVGSSAGSRMSAGGSAVASAYEWAVGSCAGSRMSAGGSVVEIGRASCRER